MALAPKKILSWFNPLPFDAPITYPRQIPKVVVPSFIGEAGQVLNLLMHHGAGTIVRDYSGYGNGGAFIVPPGWVDGSWGWALRFNGLTNYVRVPHSASLNVSTGITAEAWIRLTALGTGVHKYILSKNYAVAYTFYIAPDDTVRCILNGLTDPYPSGAPAPIADFKWHYAGVAYDGAFIDTYLDGVRQIHDDSTGNIGSGVGPLIVGLRDDLVQGFLGDIALLRLYNVHKGDAYMAKSYERTRAIFGV